MKDDLKPTLQDLCNAMGNWKYHDELRLKSLSERDSAAKLLKQREAELAQTEQRVSDNEMIIRKMLDKMK